MTEGGVLRPRPEDVWQRDAWRRDVRRRYDAGAAGYDDRHQLPALVQRYELVEHSLRELARGADAVLDLGSGTGRLLPRLQARLRVGIDISTAMLRHSDCNGHGDRAVACADAHRLPFPDDTFDVIVAARAVFRYLSPARAMVECARVLRPGGRLGIHQYADFTVASRFWRTKRPEPLHLRSPRDLDADAEAAGLVPTSREVWRTWNRYPYAFRVPEWTPRGLWSQCVLTFSAKASR